MTIEEKATEWVNGEVDRTYVPDTNLAYRQDLKQGYVAGAKENGVVWHDLRKNPDDLPSLIGCRYLVSNTHTEMIGYWNGDVFVSGAEEIAEIDGVVAWCKIPKFEV